MAIRPHPTDPGSWQIDYYRNGKRTRLKFTGSERAALEYELSVRRSHRVEVPGHYKIVDLLPEWLDFYRTNKARNTYLDAVASLKALRPFFGQLHINELSPALIEQYKQQRLLTKNRNRTGLISKRTINKELSYLSSFCRWAAENNQAEPLPFKIRPFAKVRAPKPRPLSPSQLTAILEALEPEYRLPFLLMADGGLRRTEALLLKKEDVSLEMDVLFVRGKGGKERILPIASERLREALTEGLAGREAEIGRGKKKRKVRVLSEYLAANPYTGQPYTHMRKALLRAAKQAGLDKHVHHHLLRHSFGTSMAALGLDIAHIQDLMGHSDPKTSRIYTQLAAETLRRAIARARKNQE